MVGNKRHLFTLQTRSSALDSHGEDILSYTTLAKAWGSLEAVSATEQLESQQIKATVTHKIMIRYGASYAGIAPQDRVILGTRTFDIVSVLDKDGRSHELELTVKERL